MVLAVDLPLDEERQLRVVDEVEDADLTPGQLETVGPAAVAANRLATEALLDGGDVVDARDPAEPAAARFAAALDGLAERLDVGRRVVKVTDDLEVRAAGERQHEVARAEPGVEPSIGEASTERSAEALDGRGETFGAGCISKVVKAHVHILPDVRTTSSTGPGLRRYRSTVVATMTAR